MDFAWYNILTWCDEPSLEKKTYMLIKCSIFETFTLMQQGSDGYATVDNSPSVQLTQAAAGSKRIRKGTCVCLGNGDGK